jgi:superfamily II DNA or RNA helicase
MPTITLDSALNACTVADLQSVVDALGGEQRDAGTSLNQLRAWLARRVGDAPTLLRAAGSAVLDRIAQKHGLRRVQDSLLGHEGDSALRERLLAAAAEQNDELFVSPGPDANGYPRAGSVVIVRQRQWLVQSIEHDEQGGGQTAVWLVSLDDDNAGRPLRIYWEMELGARVLQPGTDGIGQPTRLDSARDFSAWTRAIRWNVVSATRTDIFVSPFRAGIQIHDYQMVPLIRALDLPRANLFIADDVGLGKTIETGLIIQELIQRQRIDNVLVISPAGVTRQWQSEMQQRFGLRFLVYTRDEAAFLRKKHGWGTNPWSTWPRFVVSYQTLQRSEHRESLLQHLGDRLSRSLLVVDEAHTFAPATDSRYAIDSDLTGMMRTIASRFENRIFLSATPHNGHSNAFSALLEIVDPNRFVRGVPVGNPAKLEPILVRRLKSDLAALGAQFPKRRVQALTLTHDEGAWSYRIVEESTPGDENPPPGHFAPVVLGSTHTAELQLLPMLARYAELLGDSSKRNRMIFATLQKRLLSSIPAFYRTLQVHARSAGPRLASLTTLVDVDSQPEDARDQLEFAPLLEGPAPETLPTVGGSALQLIERMTALAKQYEHPPDARLLALRHWVRQHLCSGYGDEESPTPWNEQRLLIFTEYRDTQRWLLRHLRGWAAGTPGGERRVGQLDGQTGDDEREATIEAFNGEPEKNGLRILVATDAAREGINLQSRCNQLIHFDIPWNPSRLEQRNGRIDRHLQPAKEVFCNYFSFPQRPEDRVLNTLVRKVDIVTRELGSMGDVVLTRVERDLAQGITRQSEARVNEHFSSIDSDAGVQNARQELGHTSARTKVLKAEIQLAAKALQRSQEFADFDAPALRSVVETGLSHACGQPVKLLPEQMKDMDEAWRLPFDGRDAQLRTPPGWQATFDTLRAAREPGESFSEWRRRCPLRPVTFQPPSTMRSDVVHVHMEHALVQRIVSRFLAQGHAALDLSRVAALPVPVAGTLHAVVSGRLTLFGGMGARLHDEVVQVVVRIEDLESAEVGSLSTAEETRMQMLFADALRKPQDVTLTDVYRRRLLRAAPGIFARVWPQAQGVARLNAENARKLLQSRAEKESRDLLRIMNEQQASIEQTLQQFAQQNLKGEGFSEVERRQRRDEQQWMSKRLLDLENDRVHEPAALREMYRVSLDRFTPLSLAWLVPA